jgi:hypothetical protein
MRWFCEVSQELKHVASSKRDEQPSLFDRIALYNSFSSYRHILINDRKSGTDPNATISFGAQVYQVAHHPSFGIAPNITLFKY